MTEFAPSHFKILLVEDSPIQAEMLKRILQSAGYQTLLAKNGVEGLNLVQSKNPDLVISDATMPLMDGFELCSKIRKNPQFQNICVIMLTALTDIKDVISALNAGADNYLTKPYKEQTLLNHIKHSLLNRIDHQQEKRDYQIKLPDCSVHEVHASPRQMLNLLIATYGNIVEQNQELTKMQDEVVNLNASLASMNASLADKVSSKSNQLLLSEFKLRQTLIDSIETLAATVEMRDPYTAGHQRNVAEIATAIAKYLGLSEETIFGLHLAGVIHDIGKINTPAEILNKPGKLSKNQYALIQEHVEAGYNILKNLDFPWPIADIIHQHHERLDGSGYPNHLKGDEILLEANIIAVADVVDAISSHRPYRPSLGLLAAREELLSQRGALYAPEVVDACIHLMDTDKISIQTNKIS